MVPLARAARPVHPAVRVTSSRRCSRTGRTRRPCTRSTRARRPPSSGCRWRRWPTRRNRLQVRHPSGYIGPAFAVAGLLVWGFTGGLLSALLHLGGWERPWDATRVRDLDEAWAAARAGAGGRGVVSRERAAGRSRRAGDERGSRRVSWVDVLVVLLALIAGVSGWRHGMAVALLSFVGVLGGAILGRAARAAARRGPRGPEHAGHGQHRGGRAARRAGRDHRRVLRPAHPRPDHRRAHARRSTPRSARCCRRSTVVVAAWLVALPLASASLPGPRRGRARLRGAARRRRR